MNNRELFYRHLGQTSQFPLALEIESAKGLYMYEKNGKEYLDLISGIGVSAVGHGHPAIVSAVKDQAEKYMHLMVYGEFIESPQVRLAQLISESLPESLNNSFLVNSGSEAVEGALKLAKRYTGRPKIISCENAYHGSTHGALSVSGDEKLKNAFRPLLPMTEQITFGHGDHLERIDQQTAAVIIETVQGEAGVRTTDKAYFKALRDKCSQEGVLLILDEIQCGMGRTGKLWAFTHYDIVPDMIVSAKGLGGGMPIGAFVSSQEIMSSLTHDPILGHISTFGGHPVSAAAACATIETIQHEIDLDEVIEKGKMLRGLLQHDKILEVRGIGLMIAVEFESFQVLESIIKTLLELGILSDWFLFCDNSMRIAPPLNITEDEIKMACSKILQAIDQVYSSL